MNRPRSRLSARLAEFEASIPVPLEVEDRIVAWILLTRGEAEARAEAPEKVEEPDVGSRV
jgi:hypothetical protein